MSYICITISLKGSELMSIISVRTTEEEKELIKDYAQFFGMSVSDFIKTTVIEHIEDLFDLRAIEAYEKNRLQGTTEIISLEDAKKQLGL